MHQILEEVAVDLLSSLIKAGARAGVGFVRSAIIEKESVPGPSPPRRAAERTRPELDIFDGNLGLPPQALEQAWEEVADPFAAPEACAEDFVGCLQRGDHNRACNWCDPGLFADDERKAILLETLAAARPWRWRCRQYYHPVNWDSGEPVPWVGVDYDVMFKLDSGARTMTLIVWVVAVENGWAVWNLEWGPRRPD